MDKFFHEARFRQPELMAKLKDVAITVCGAGALGANVVEGLVRAGAGKVRVIDRDRVEEHNLSTQPYYRTDVGGHKAKLLANGLYRAVGVAVAAEATELTDRNVAKLLQGTDLVIETFDNSVARGIVKAHCADVAIPCLHAGLASDYGELIWNDDYRVPSDVNDDVCDYPLARNLALITASLACELAIRFVDSEAKNSYTLTFADFAVRPYVA